MAFVHKSVLFHETIDALNIRPDGIYVDGTAGGGGHSGAILERLTTGTLISIDQDPGCNRLCFRQIPREFLFYRSTRTIFADDGNCKQLRFYSG